jgi:hypothetical protein
MIEPSLTQPERRLFPQLTRHRCEGPLHARVHFRTQQLFPAKGRKNYELVNASETRVRCSIW